MKTKRVLLVVLLCVLVLVAVLLPTTAALATPTNPPNEWGAQHKAWDKDAGGPLGQYISGIVHQINAGNATDPPLSNFGDYVQMFKDMYR